MQPGTCNADYDWTEEQYDVTFQIALIGCDGLVVGSDRLSVQTVPSETGGPAFGQPTYQTKYCLDDTQSIICFWAVRASCPPRVRAPPQRNCRSAAGSRSPAVRRGHRTTVWGAAPDCP